MGNQRVVLLELSMAAAVAFGCGGPENRLPEDHALLRPDAPEFQTMAPDSFRVRFESTAGDFTVQVRRELAPNGADRFHNLVRAGYFDGVRFFRVIEGFMVQFGIHGDPRVNAAWRPRTIPDDPVRTSNRRGTLTFAATAAPNSRTTQLFINLVDNERLDPLGFAPIGEVVEGMEAVDNIYSGYGEGPPTGRGPDQARILTEGNAYLEREYPRMDFIRRATVIP